MYHTAQQCLKEPKHCVDGSLIFETITVTRMTAVVSTSESGAVSIVIFEDKHNLEGPVLSDVLTEPVCMLTLSWL